MNVMEKRTILFLFGCLPVRLALIAAAVAAHMYAPHILKWMGYAALIVSLGFTIIYLGDLRKTGPEVFGDTIWWNDLRPLHAALYFWFALLAIKGNKYAWVPLAIDVTVGLAAFLTHRRLSW